MDTTQVMDSRDPERIVLVDDDPGIRQVVGDYLVSEGCDVETVADGGALLKALDRRRADLVLLDVMLPGLDGLAICRKLANEHGPCVVIHSAMTETTDRVVGLELGADDYVVKPSNPRELLARIRAVLRRRAADRREPVATVICEFAGWTLNLVAHELHSPDGDMISLTHGEFSTLRRLAESPRRVLQREQLIDQSSPGRDAAAERRAVDVQICRLRRKLKPSGEELIQTVRNEGYRFNAAVRKLQSAGVGAMTAD